MPKKSRAERRDVFAEIGRLRAAEHESADRLRELLHELQVQQEEINVQNEQLISAQHAIEESRDRYIDLFDFAPIGYLALDPNGVVLEINLAGAAILGLERAKVTGLPFRGFVRPDDRKTFLEFMNSCRDGTAAGQSCEIGLKGDHAGRRVQLLGAVTRSGAVGPACLAAMVDVTEQRRLEDERRLAEEAGARAARDREIARASNDAKDRFLATLSHELRTPLNPVLAAVTDPGLAAQIPEPLRPLLAMIRRNVELEVRLIDDLLDVTRIARNRMVIDRQDIDVHEAIRDVIGIVEHQSQKRRVRISLVFEAPRSLVHADPTRLRQALWNLVSNALKFTGPGGGIAITTHVVGDDRIEIAVSDSGRGMDSETLAELFLPADQRPPRPLRDGAGLGLGVWICRNIVEVHGGTLAAASPGKGRGSTFRIELPLILEPAPQVPEAMPAPHTSPVQPLTILLVEDHEDSAEMLSAILRHHGYAVTVAHTMKDAVSLVTRMKCDLVISDLNLPDGSGLDLLKVIPATEPTRAIALSGFGTPEDQRRSAAAGYAAHLTKPIDMPRLLQTIARVTGA